MTDGAAPDGSLLRTGISVSVRDGRFHAVVALHGELCAMTADELRGELEQLVADGVSEVTIDLRELRLCTSHGVDVFDEVDRALRTRHGGSLCLDVAGAAQVVRDVLKVVRDQDPTFSPQVAEASAASGDGPHRAVR